MTEWPKTTVDRLRAVYDKAARLLERIDYELEWADPEFGPTCFEPERVIGQVEQHIQAAIDLLLDDRDEVIRINQRPQLVKA